MYLIKNTILMKGRERDRGEKRERRKVRERESVVKRERGREIHTQTTKIHLINKLNSVTLYTIYTHTCCMLTQTHCMHSHTPTHCMQSHNLTAWTHTLTPCYETHDHSLPPSHTITHFLSLSHSPSNLPRLNPNCPPSISTSG